MSFQSGDRKVTDTTIASYRMHCTLALPLRMMIPRSLTGLNRGELLAYLRSLPLLTMDFLLIPKTMVWYAQFANACVSQLKLCSDNKVKPKPHPILGKRLVHAPGLVGTPPSSSAAICR
ncbi:hypothetical protein [Pantanalinema sp. GBBB05]|uniref:hypothetical protein n=1 Tax=Pantanalinema sp. GBBB05 TaxID=2604139 RepID=UPI001E002686|nr:hypothetical protein [Pantanalinema sp. GBBB05]